MRNPSGPLHSSMQISANSHGNHYRGLSLGRCIMQTTELSRQPPKQPGLSGQVDVKQFTSEITKNLLKQPQAAVEILSPQFWNHKCWFRLKWQTCKLPPCCRAAGTPPHPPGPSIHPWAPPQAQQPCSPLCLPLLLLIAPMEAFHILFLLPDFRSGVIFLTSHTRSHPPVPLPFFLFSQRHLSKL